MKFIKFCIGAILFLVLLWMLVISLGFCVAVTEGV